MSASNTSTQTADEPRRSRMAKSLDALNGGRPGMVTGTGSSQAPAPAGPAGAAAPPATPPARPRGARGGGPAPPATAPAVTGGTGTAGAGFRSKSSSPRRGLAAAAV